MSNQDQNEEISESYEYQEEGFWNGRTIATIILIILLIATGLFVFRNRDDSTTDSNTSVEDKIQEIQEEQGEEDTATETPEDTADTESQEQGESTDTASQPEQQDIVTKSSNSITVKAERGDGVTHLARKAVAQYASDNALTLSVEQKLYAETVLKNAHRDHQLDTGDSIQFENSEVATVVTNAQNLSPDQIAAWSKYVPYVPSLH